MDKVTTITGVAVPLRRSNVDTDQILPSDYGKRITRTGYQDALFAEWREDPGFILNQPEYRNPAILIAGPDFGIGSSREHAVWALYDYGFRAVFSPRFSDIFRGNSGKCGLLAGRVSQTDTDRLWNWLEDHRGEALDVDLRSKTISGGDVLVRFQIDDYTRWQLLEGLDDIALTLRNEAHITAFESRRENWRPRTLPLPPADR